MHLPIQNTHLTLNQADCYHPCDGGDDRGDDCDGNRDGNRDGDRDDDEEDAFSMCCGTSDPNSVDFDYFLSNRRQNSVSYANEEKPCRKSSSDASWNTAECLEDACVDDSVRP